MHDAFRNAFVIEVRDLFAKDEIFQQRRTAIARFERVLIVVDANALIGREKLISPFPQYTFPGRAIFSLSSSFRWPFTHLLLLILRTPRRMYSRLRKR